MWQTWFNLGLTYIDFIISMYIVIYGNVCMLKIKHNDYSGDLRMVWWFCAIYMIVRVILL